MAAIALAIAGALPAVWWESLHVDEAITLDYAPRSLLTLLHDVFVERGGSPVHFLVEHLTLSWPGGIEGLRLPSLVAFVLALPVAWVVLGQLAEPRARDAAVLLLACAPLALSLATFARMYTLFLAVVLIGLAACVRAGRSGEPWHWVVAGVVCGVAVYVHPVAPLYVALCVATGILASPHSIRRAVRAAWPAAAVALAVALPYLYALSVLRSRYGVGIGGEAPATTAGRSVAEESLRSFAAGGTVGAAALVTFAIVGLIEATRRSTHQGLALAAWLVVPVAFFSLVPADDARFYPRYVLPALPVFLLLVAIGCFALTRRVRLGSALGGLLVAAILVVQADAAVDRLRELRSTHLRDLTDEVARRSAGSVLFGSTGTARPDRPPELLDSYLELELDRLQRVDELPAVEPRHEPGAERRGVAAVRAFIATGDRARGIWLFEGIPRRVRRAERLLQRRTDLEVRRLGPRLLVVHSSERAPPHELVTLGRAVRAAWALPVPRDDLVRMIMRVDTAALDARRVGLSAR